MISTVTRISDGGRVVIPAEFRRALGVEPGDRVVLELRNGEVAVLTPAQAVERARALVRRYAPRRDGSVVDEFLRERKEEAADE